MSSILSAIERAREKKQRKLQVYFNKPEAIARRAAIEFALSLGMVAMPFSDDFQHGIPLDIPEPWNPE